MCGVTGFVSSNKKSNTLLNMSKKLLHRGPDDFGYWINSDNNVFLAHQRLSIIELSKLGKQPMISPSKNFIISFNGEIYNHLVLRKELENNYEIMQLYTSTISAQGVNKLKYAIENDGVELNRTKIRTMLLKDGIGTLNIDELMLMLRSHKKV